MSATNPTPIVWHLLPPGRKMPTPASADLLGTLLLDGYSILTLPSDGRLAQQFARQRPDLIHALSPSAAHCLTPLAASRTVVGPLPPVIVNCAAGERVPAALAALLRSATVACILATDAVTQQRLILDMGIDPTKVRLNPSDPGAIATLYRHILDSPPVQPPPPPSSAPGPRPTTP